jgi:hypothetical protein
MHGYALCFTRQPIGNDHARMALRLLVAKSVRGTKVVMDGLGRAMRGSRVMGITRELFLRDDGCRQVPVCSSTGNTNTCPRKEAGLSAPSMTPEPASSAELVTVP